MDLSRKRGKEFLGRAAGEFLVVPITGGNPGASRIVGPMISANLGNDCRMETVQTRKGDFHGDFSLSHASFWNFPCELREIERNQRGEEKVAGFPQVVDDCNYIEGKSLNTGHIVRKLKILGQSICDQCINSFGEAASQWESGGYICSTCGSCYSSRSSSQKSKTHVCSFPSRGSGLRDMASRGEAQERPEWLKQKRVESSGGMLAQAAGIVSPLAGMVSPSATVGEVVTQTPSTPDRLGKTASRRL